MQPNGRKLWRKLARDSNLLSRRLRGSQGALFGLCVVVNPPSSMAAARPTLAPTAIIGAVDPPERSGDEPNAEDKPPERSGDEPNAEDKPPERNSTSEEDKAESRRHFQMGISLYEDKNYTAALAEFEAAYRQYPSASALQNVALCLKQLYRYSEAREALARLLRTHRNELDGNEVAAVDAAVDELGALIGSVVITVSPANAKISLDGRTVSAQDLRAPIPLDVGEHRVTAEAPGYAPMTRSFRIAGGHTEVPVTLALTETTGQVTITAPDPQTAIAIDGRPVAFARWSGRLDPGRHFVQIYRDGFEPYEEEIEVEVGSTTHVRGVLDERTDPSEIATNATDPNARSKRPQIGYYGLASLGFLVPRGHPVGFDAKSDYDLGWSLGLRAGYRLLPPLGLEAQVDSASFSVDGRCANRIPTACPDAGTLSYKLDARRFGAGLRLFSSNESVRLTSVFGGGIASHDFHLSSYKATGLDPYLVVEVGLLANYRHTLWEFVATAHFEGGSSIRVGDFRPYADASGIQTFGIALRLGWGEWQPSRAPLPPLPARDATTSK